MEKLPHWMLSLEQEDLEFIKNFILHSGSLKDIAKQYDVSYPTVRLRLDKLIQKIKLSDEQDNTPFVTYISQLAIDSQIELETAKQIIKHYKKNHKEDKHA